jgi:large repetitive protein
MKCSFRLVLAAVAAAAGLTASTASAQLSYTGGTISNDFDGLPTNATNPSQVISGRGPHEFSVVNGVTPNSMTGWQLANPTGSSTSTEFRSQNGSLAGSTGRGVISFGVNGSNERALGLLSTSNQINTFGLVLVNNSSNTYSGFSVSFTGEQWRRGEPGVNNTMSFAYGLASSIGGSLNVVPSLGFTNPNTQASPTEVALNGNDPANQVLRAGTITGISWAPGQTLALRWSVNDASGQDNGMGIDDLSFRAVPEPSSLAMAALGSMGVSGSLLRRRRRLAGIDC